MPTRSHQLLLKVLLRLFEQAIEPSGGIVLFAPPRLRLRPGKFREPDLLLLLDVADPRNQERYWDGADLVLEIVSADQLECDLGEKRWEYAEAGIPEYWIVDPLNQAIIVLTLDERRYVEHGVFRPGTRATSALLAGFSLAVSDLFGPV